MSTQSVKKRAATTLAPRANTNAQKLDDTSPLTASPANTTPKIEPSENPEAVAAKQDTQRPSLFRRSIIMTNSFLSMLSLSKSAADQPPAPPPASSTPAKPPHPIQCGVFSLRGRRPYNEDRYTSILNFNKRANEAFFAIYDGHGGKAASKYAAEHLHRVFQRHPEYDTDVKKSLSEAFEQTDDEFLTTTEKVQEPSGTTACVAFLKNRTLYVANAGDSRAVLYSKGNCRPLSVDHKPDLPEERRRVQECGGQVIFSMGTWRVQGILAMSRALGDRDIKSYITSRPDIIEIPLTGNDGMLIVASDGVWDVFTNEAAGKLVWACPSAEAAAKNLTQEAYNRGSADNVSAIVVDLRRYIEELTKREAMAEQQRLQKLKEAQQAAQTTAGASTTSVDVSQQDSPAAGVASPPNLADSTELDLPSAKVSPPRLGLARSTTDGSLEEITPRDAVNEPDDANYPRAPLVRSDTIVDFELTPTTPSGVFDLSSLGEES